MIDWTAIGAIAAIAALAFAYFQWRGRGSAKVEYRIVRSRIGLKPPIFEQAWDHPQIREYLRFTERLHHGSVFIWNRSSHATGEVQFEIDLIDFALGRLEYTSSLGDNACKFRVVKGNKVILEFQDLPANEKLIISLTGSLVGYTLKSLNSNAKLSNVFNDFSWG